MSHKPSFAPVLMAAGLMFTLWGAVTTWLISAGGLVVVAFAGLRWMRDSREEPRAAAAPVQERTEPPAPLAGNAPTDRRAESRQTNPWLHRCAILIGAAAFGLVVTGALMTSNPNAPSPVVQPLHFGIAGAVGILAVYLGFGFGGPAWLLPAAIAVQALLGLSTAPVPGTFHALLAQLIFAGTVALALVTAPGWREASGLLNDSPRLPLRKLSLLTLALVIVQVSLGSAYRHQAMGVVPHIVNALIVTIAILLTAVLVTNLYPEHKALRPAAKTLIGITFAQVMLGMGAFITRLMMAQGTLPVVIAGVAHVAMGALTLSTTLLLTLLIRHYLRPAA